MPRAFCINIDDNVATMLDDASEPGPVQVLGATRVKEIASRAAISLGHKIALCDIAERQPIVKFAVVIGRASGQIQAGDWVHLHNCVSNFDERSQTLDIHTGAATDTKYE